MTDIPGSFLHYLQAWNERDVDRVRGHLEAAVTDGVVFADPDNYAEGRDDVEALIVRARSLERPDADYGLASGIDGHNRRYRYRWVVRAGDAELATGMDVVTVAADDRIERIDGFFGDFPDL
jgi:hypothetical protein